MKALFHIISEQTADGAKRASVYRPDSLQGEGFIHCSYADQVCRVADFLYRGRSDLLLLEVDSSRMSAKVLVEDLYESGEPFPHIYGELPWRAVAAVHAFPCAEDGTFCLPATVGSRS